MDITEFNGNLEKPTEQNEINPKIKVYKKRWFILIIFMLFTTTSAIQNSQYTVVANVIQKYYQVPYYAIDWTMMMGNLLFIIFSFPASFILDKLGLRKTVIIGVVGTAIGTWIKFASVHPDRFWVVLIGHGIVALFAICYIPVLPKVAAAWFGYKQIVIATGLGVVGVEAGTALSFLLPTLIVVESNVERGLYTIILVFAVCSTIMVPIVILFFPEEPKFPPSNALQNYIKTRETDTPNFIKECQELFTNKNFLMFSLITAVSSSSVGSMETLFNQIILYYYPGETVHVGIAGSLHIFCSLLGSITVSNITDKLKRFKSITWVVYGSLLLSLILFASTLHLGLPMVYISFLLLGAFFGATETLHYEIVLELTYPQSQNVSVGLSTIINRLIGILFITLYGTIHRSVGNSWANITMISIVICVDLLFFVMKFNLRKSKGEMERSNKANS